MLFNVYSLFTNIPLKEIINICTNLQYNNIDVIESLNKSEFKNLLSLATLELYFMFDDILYKQKHGVVMGSPLGPTKANVFLSFLKWNGLNSALTNSNQFFREDMLIIFSFYLNQLNISQNLMHISISNMSFSFEQEVNGKLPFIDVEESRQQGKFVTTVYWKPTFSSVYTHFHSFLPTDYKVGMRCTLAYRCFKICSDWTRLHEELNFLKHVFLKNGCPLSFVDKCFKMVFNKLVIKGLQVKTVENKTLVLPLPYLGDVSLQTRTKLKKSFKGILNCCKLQIVFKSR